MASSKTVTLIRIDTQYGREELRYDMTHEKAKAIFCSQYGFDRFTIGAKRNGIRIESYDTIVEWDRTNDSSRSSSSNSRSSSSGSSVTGAVVGGTVGLVGAGLGWIGSSIKEGMDEADREEAEAKAEGGERLAKWEKDQANSDKWVGRFGRYGGAYVGIGILSALGVELLVTPLALGMMGYISYKVVSKTINKLNGAYVKPNRPASVQSQYRKETI